MIAAPGTFGGKVAIVTGAATGLGQGIAEGLFRRGAAVVLTDVDGEGVTRVAGRLDPEGLRCVGQRADVGDPAASEATVTAAVERFGGLHLAVNNAGITGDHGVALADVPVDAWQRILSTNLSGVFYGMRHQIPAMLASGGGSIVNMSSAAGAVGQAGLAPYSATKHGIIGLTRSAALDYAKLGIRVNAIGPGYVDVPTMREAPQAVLDGFARAQPIGRLGTVAEVVDTVAFMLSDEASFLVGAFIIADGGYTAG